MNVRDIFSVIFAVLSVAIAVCALVAYHSEKEIGKSVSMLLVSLLPPVIGNFLIISSSTRLPAEVGCYMYYIGIDFTVYSLLRYAVEYCRIPWVTPRLHKIILTLFGIDILQLLANTIFHHAFDIEQIELYGEAYYRMIPYLPQNLHRALVYLVLLAVLVTFLVKVVHSSRIHARRYGLILGTMIIVIGWCTFYVVSRTPLDRSMIGYGVFGLLVFYFSLYYKPVSLLNRILVDISSELPDAMFFFDDVGTCVWANRAGMELAGIQGRTFEGAEKKLDWFFEAGGHRNEANWKAEAVHGTGDARMFYVMEKRTILDERGRVDGSFLAIRDDTAMRMKLERETYLARHDALTGLYRRSYLYKLISETIADNPDQKYSVTFLNVRNFKLVNEMFGNDFGDEVLIRIANLIRDNVPSDSCYGRLSGDTFGIFTLQGAMGAKEIDNILSGFSVSNNDIKYHVSIHIGVYRIAESDRDVSVMFERARIAASSIQKDYQAHIAYYSDDMRAQMRWEQEIAAELNEAIHKRQIIPYLQPIVDTQGKMVGAEALVRWIHPVKGFLSPASFIPVLEGNGMIVEVDRYMWRCACEILARWSANDFFVSVNVSPNDFYLVDVPEEFRALVNEFGIEPSRLRIEITESIMISDLEIKTKTLRRLRDLGFIVEMDDFGSGYSSLNVLKDMPIHVLKIDMLFLRNAEDDEKSAIILRNIINMSSDLKLVPLSEGVEKKDQFDFLTAIGCQLFQGYYFAKPMPVTEFEEQFLRQKS